MRLSKNAEMLKLGTSLTIGFSPKDNNDGNEIEWKLEILLRKLAWTDEKFNVFLPRYDKAPRKECYIFVFDKRI